MLANWIRETTTSTGTGDLTLSAVSGYPRFSDAFPVLTTLEGEPFPYAILDDSTGAPIELGWGELTATSTLKRLKPVWTYVSGSLGKVAPSAVNLGAGTKRVICPDMHGARLVVPPRCTAYSGDNLDVLSADAANHNNNSTTVNMANNGCRAETFLFTHSQPVSHFVVEVTTAQSGGECVVGLYTHGRGSASNIGGTLVCQSGAIDCSTTGFKAGAVGGGSIFIPPGRYWWVLCNKINNTTFRGYQGYFTGGGRRVGSFGWSRAYNRSNTYSTTMPSALSSFGGDWNEGTPGVGYMGELRLVNIS